MLMLFWLVIGVLLILMPTFNGVLQPFLPLLLWAIVGRLAG